ncbi:hypothetical protein MBLNU13_g07339t1 [Cladosporium sp. NU13]
MPYTIDQINVLITTCGERTDVVMKTVRAAASQTYPSQSYQVFVLDDSRNDGLQEAIDQFDHGLRLTSPGNTRFGLSTTLDSRGGSGYIAVLDADIVPEETWLKRTVHPLENDQQLSMASPPQQFHNVPAGDLLGQDIDVFAQILEPLRDCFGCSQ